MEKIYRTNTRREESDGSKNFCYLHFVKPKNLRLLKVFCVAIFVNSAYPSGSTVLDS